MVVLMGIVLLCGCKTSSQYKDTGSLVFVSKKDYVGKAVFVSIDSHPPFMAKVISKSDWNKYVARTAVHTKTNNRTNTIQDYRWKPDNSNWSETKEKTNLVPTYGVVAGQREVMVSFDGKTVLRKKTKVRADDKTVIEVP